MRDISESFRMRDIRRSNATLDLPETGAAGQQLALIATMRLCRVGSMIELC
jgi:hypothetical protein